MRFISQRHCSYESFPASGRVNYRLAHRGRGKAEFIAKGKSKNYE